jgi:hypothetical protein
MNAQNALLTSADGQSPGTARKGIRFECTASRCLKAKKSQTLPKGFWPMEQTAKQPLFPMGQVVISLERGNPLFSAYHTHAGDELWVITDRQFSTTTILLPEEF